MCRIMSHERRQIQNHTLSRGRIEEYQRNQEKDKDLKKSGEEDDKVI